MHPTRRESSDRHVIQLVARFECRSRSRNAVELVTLARDGDKLRFLLLTWNALFDLFDHQAPTAVESVRVSCCDKNEVG